MYLLLLDSTEIWQIGPELGIEDDPFASIEDDDKRWLDQEFDMDRAVYDGTEVIGKVPPRVKKTEKNKLKPSYPFSPDGMKKLAIVEERIYQEMKNYIKNMDLRLDLMIRSTMNIFHDFINFIYSFNFPTKL